MFKAILTNSIQCQRNEITSAKPSDELKTPRLGQQLKSGPTVHTLWAKSSWWQFQVHNTTNGPCVTGINRLKKHNTQTLKMHSDKVHVAS